jgi:hypothetical protein
VAPSFHNGTRLDIERSRDGLGRDVADRLIGQERNHGARASQHDADRIVGGNQHDRPQQARAGCRTAEREDERHGDIRGGAEQSGLSRRWLVGGDLHVASVGRGRVRHPRAVAIHLRCDRLRRLKLLLESPDHVLGIETHTLGVRAHECPPEDPSGPSRDIVGLEPFQQAERHFGFLRDRSQRQPAMLPLAAQVGS